MSNYLTDLPSDLVYIDTNPELRRGYWFGEEVVIAPKRGKRPHEDSSSISEPQLKRSEIGLKLIAEPAIDQIEDIDGNWLVKSIANGFPTITENNPKARGQQEIIIDTPEIDKNFEDLDIGQLVNLFSFYQARSRALSRLPDIRYVSIFKNQGIHAGASIAHPHTQVFALEWIPEKIQRQHRQLSRIDSPNPIQETIEQELSKATRIVTQTERWTVFCPYASINPMEVWLIPAREILEFSHLDHLEITQLTGLISPLVKRLGDSGIDFNLLIENGLMNPDRLIIKLIPRGLINSGGFELGTNIIINPVSPESATSWYRQGYL
ncbi:DUF4931 domain-containing protein [Candidatus Saccharibacteria bacterium]|nr:DUF4931 domain-containing protein [Candidatus Saccharibacteria bacterium]MCB9834416.1 DUF4931 domain-containing protein [Candidatus Nomurabacteria bacterium]